MDTVWYPRTCLETASSGREPIEVVALRLRLGRSRLRSGGHSATTVSLLSVDIIVLSWHAK